MSRLAKTTLILSTLLSAITALAVTALPTFENGVKDLSSLGIEAKDLPDPLPAKGYFKVLTEKPKRLIVRIVPTDPTDPKSRLAADLYIDTAPKFRFLLGRDKFTVRKVQAGKGSENTDLADFVSMNADQKWAASLAKTMGQEAALACPSINLLDTHPEVAAAIPEEKQSAFGNCFSYAASTIMNSELKSRAINPLDLTLVSSNTKETFAGFTTTDEVDAFEKGTRLSDADELIRKVGYCPPEEFEKILGSWAPTFNIKPGEDQWQSRTLVALRSFLQEISDARAADEITSFYKLKPTQNLRAVCHLPVHDPKSILKSIRELGSFVVIDALHSMVGSCSDKRIKPKLPKLKTVDSGDDGDMQRAIEAGLNSGKPVYVSYCSSVLLVPGSVGLNGNTTLRADKSNAKENCGDHASTVVGQYFANGSCNYLVVEPGKKSVKQTPFNFNGKKVGFTAPRDNFSSNVYSISHY